MKNILIVLSISSALGQLDCYWAVGQSGNKVECLPDFYIKGGCESGSRDDCNFGGILGGDSFGINCCPSDRSISFENRSDCQWHYGDR